MKKIASILTKKRIHILILLSLPLIGVGIWSNSTAQILEAGKRKDPSEKAVSHNVQIEKPEVTIKNETGSPLQIEIVNADRASIKTPELTIRVRNTGEIPVRAYSIYYEVVLPSTKAAGMELTNKASSLSVLHPGQSEEQEIGSGSHYSTPISNIVVSVDFVEFTSGGRWGPDRFKSADRLDGQRAGARLATEYLLSLLRSKGALTVTNSVEDLEITPPPNMSEEWVSGFRAGVGVIRGRLKMDYKKGGAAEIEVLVKRPYDASQEAQK